MTINISEYADVEKRASELNLNEPKNITFIPRNFLGVVSKTELVNEASVSTLRTLFRQNKLQESRFDSAENKIPYIHENAFDWICPAIFFSAAELSKNPELISIACGVIGNYLTDFFKGKKSNPNIKLEVIVKTTKNKKTKKITYEGNLEGIKEIASSVKEAMRE